MGKQNSIPNSMANFIYLEQIEYLGQFELDQVKFQSIVFVFLINIYTFYNDHVDKMEPRENWIKKSGTGIRNWKFIGKFLVISKKNFQIDELDFIIKSAQNKINVKMETEKTASIEIEKNFFK